MSEVLMGSVSGWFLADVVGAAAHIYTDAIYEEGDEVNGTVASSHHFDTLNYDDLNLTDEICAGTAISLLFAAPMQVANDHKIQAHTLDIALVMMYLGSMVTLWSHDMAHRRNHFGEEDVGPFVAWLQDQRFLLHPEEHRKHHGGDHNSDFGSLNNWSSSLFNWATKRWFPKSPLTSQQLEARTRAVNSRKIAKSKSESNGSSMWTFAIKWLAKSSCC